MAGNDIKTAKLLLMSFLGSTIIVVLILVMTVLYYASEKRLEYERSVRPPFEETEQALLDQRTRLEEFEKLADVQEQGKARPAFRIPIRFAMDKVLADWRSGALPGPVVESTAAPPAAAKSGTPSEPKGTASKSSGADPKEKGSNGKQ
jgi:hypothetical protein